MRKKYLFCLLGTKLHPFNSFSTYSDAISNSLTSKLIHPISWPTLIESNTPCLQAPTSKRIYKGKGGHQGTKIDRQSTHWLETALTDKCPQNLNIFSSKLRDPDPIH